MTTACPKCAYVRQPTETAPDYECPRCGIIYAKFRPSQPATSARGAEYKPPGANESPVARLVAWSLLILLGAGGGAYAYTMKQKRDEIAATRASLSQLHDAAARFSQAVKLASSTGRIALAGPVKDLQTITNEIKALRPTGCAVPAHEPLIRASTETVDSFLAFMRGSAYESQSSSAMEAASEHVQIYRKKVEECAQSLDDA